MGYSARILWKQLDDRDLADGLAILSHIHSQIQDKTIRLASSSEGLELKINGKKTELINMNTSLNIPFLISGEFTNPPGGVCSWSTWKVLLTNIETPIKALRQESVRQDKFLLLC